ncbi:hypothetical protein COCNU_04G007690 [Cocos nucifera]|uniref:Uncharacterized protein n=1 Tax=Cocos nucifera TaxID=13894 RepID=A0A8K0N088_COCNU|nr:hypothetical protein COCNU_04G007690 [Cocos nucifera]
MRTNFACSRAVRGVILQAPVSDREYRATLPETAAMIDLAVKMITEGKGMELMPREANPDAPITAYRYHSLCAYMGDDDMFSSDLSEDQLRLRLGHMSSTPCQLLCSFTLRLLHQMPSTIIGLTYGCNDSQNLGLQMHGTTSTVKA